MDFVQSLQLEKVVGYYISSNPILSDPIIENCALLPYSVVLVSNIAPDDLAFCLPQKIIT